MLGCSSASSSSLCMSWRHALFATSCIKIACKHNIMSALRMCGIRQLLQLFDITRLSERRLYLYSSKAIAGQHILFLMLIPGRLLRTCPSVPSYPTYQFLHPQQLLRAQDTNSSNFHCRQVGLPHKRYFGPAAGTKIYFPFQVTPFYLRPLFVLSHPPPAFFFLRPASRARALYALMPVLSSACLGELQNS